MAYLAIIVLRHLRCGGRDRICSSSESGYNAHSHTFSRRAYFSKPRMYGMIGGRGPVLKSGPRVERYVMSMNGVFMRRPMG